MHFGWTKREKKLALGFLFFCFLLISLYVYDHSSKHTEKMKEQEKLENDSTQQAQPSSEKPTSENPAVLYADVKGAVAHPGVYSFQKGARVGTLVELSGGLLPDADEKTINLAKPINDGEMLYIPRKGEAPASAGPGKHGDTMAGQSGKLVSINLATETELNTLPGIGEAKAHAIVTYRSEHGPFLKKEDLKKVNGMGDKLYDRIKEMISLN